MKKEKGFSLVELLVVLAIVGILMGLAIGGIRIVQQVNRDTQRKALVRDIQLVVEAYQERKNRYPLSISLDESGDKIHITTPDTDDEVYSAAFFDITGFDTEDGDCADFETEKETDSGNLTGCYDYEGQGYGLIIDLERTADGYDASTAEITATP